METKKNIDHLKGTFHDDLAEIWMGLDMPIENLLVIDDLCTITEDNATRCIRIGYIICDWSEDDGPLKLSNTTKDEEKFTSPNDDEIIED